MNFDNFLARAYFKSLNLKDLQLHNDLQQDEKVDGLIARFEALSQKYPDNSLEKAGCLSPELLEKIRHMGLFGLNIPMEYGGQGLNIHQYLRVVKAISKNSMVLGFTALAHLSIGVKGILLFGNDTQKKFYLPRAASGEMIFAYALTEPLTGSDAKNIQTTATLDKNGRDYILNGRKTYITNANYAGGLTVFAQMDPDNPGHIGAFIVETNSKGLTVGREMPKMGLKATSTAGIRFKDVRVPEKNLLGRPGDGFKIAMTILNYGRLALGASSDGLMELSLEDMISRSGSRKQFGVPIRNFELIQDKLVQARVNQYAAATMTDFTADLLSKDPLAPVAIESSHCKLFGTTRAWDTLYNAQQVAGGAGYLSTLPYEKRLRDFRVSTIFEGTTEIHSIYPALYLLRIMIRGMKSISGGRLGQAIHLVKAMLTGVPWKIPYKNRKMKQAARYARSNARQIKFLIHAGLLRYGRKIMNQEFLLKRITLLSLHTFTILSILARITALKKAGMNVARDIEIMSYFVAMARDNRIQGKLSTIPERINLHQRIFQKIIKNNEVQIT